MTEQLVLDFVRSHPELSVCDGFAQTSKFTDSNGNRLTAFATNITGGQLADLELRHRRRARCEDRIRSSKDTGLNNLPLNDFAQNQVWIAVVQLATELTAWIQMLASPAPRRGPGNPRSCGTDCSAWAPGSAAMARLTWLRMSAHAPHRDLLLHGIHGLQSLPHPT